MNTRNTSPIVAHALFLAALILVTVDALADNSGSPNISQKKSCNAGSLDPKYGTGGVAVVVAGNLGYSNTSDGIVMNDQDRVTIPLVSAPDTSGVDTISLYRVDKKGVLDPNFGTGGQVIVGQVLDPSLSTTMGQDPQGRLLLAVTTNIATRPVPGLVSTVTIYRFHPDGKVAEGFGTNGAVSFELGSAFQIEGVTADDKSRVLYTTGSTNPASGNMEITLVRLKEDGTLDTSFGTGGTAYAAIPGYYDRATDVLVQEDGKIIVLGRIAAYNPVHFLFFATRFNSNGTLDTGYGTGGFTIVDFGANTVADGRKGKLQNDGKLIFGGSVLPDANNNLIAGFVRLNRDGTPDATFGTGGKAAYLLSPFGGSIIDLDLQADGRVVASGQEYLDAAQDSSSAILMRMNADGTLDTTYAGSGIDVLTIPGYPSPSAGYVRINSQNIAIETVSGSATAAYSPSLLVGVEGDCN